MACLLMLLLAGTRPAAANQDIVINEVHYRGDDTSDWIELKNTGNSTVDVSNWQLCTHLRYRRLGLLTLLDGNDLMMDPGEIITLQSWRDLDNTAADLGLYVNTGFTNPAAMVDFVQWGSSSLIGRSEVASLKGIWSENPQGVYDFVATAADGESVAFSGTNTGGGFLTLSGDLSNGPPTPGSENSPAPVEPSTWGLIKEIFRSQ